MSHPPGRPPEVPIPGADGYLPSPSGRSLYCVSHLAPAAATPPHGSIVLAQAFTEERKASHRSMLRLAAHLAAAGWSTHRLDLSGCGESTGDLAALRLQHWLDDFAFAAGELLKDTPPAQQWIGGLRIGATVAGLCKFPPTARWLAIAPILQGKVLLRQLRTRQVIRKEMTATESASSPSAAPAPPASPAPSAEAAEDFDGFVLNAAMLQDLEALDLPTQLQRTAGLVIQAGPAKSITREFQALAPAPARSKNLRIVPVRQEPFWERGESIDDHPLIAAILKALQS